MIFYKVQRKFSLSLFLLSSCLLQSFYLFFSPPLLINISCQFRYINQENYSLGMALRGIMYTKSVEVNRDTQSAWRPTLNLESIILCANLFFPWMRELVYHKHSFFFSPRCGELPHSPYAVYYSPCLTILWKCESESVILVLFLRYFVTLTWKKNPLKCVSVSNLLYS